MNGLVFGFVGVLVLAVVVIATIQRLARNGTPPGGWGVADGLGNFIDVFDPARARADRDLKSHDNQGTIAPSPDDDRPVTVDLDTGTATVRRPQHP